MRPKSRISEKSQSSFIPWTARRTFSGQGTTGIHNKFSHDGADKMEVSELDESDGAGKTILEIRSAVSTLVACPDELCDIC